MRGPSSLSNRIFLACTVLATLSLGVAFWFVNERVTEEVEAELRHGLTDAATLVDERRTTLTDTYTRIARLVADLPKLKAAVDSGDPPTVQPLAEDYRQQIDADLLVVWDPRGQVLGAAGTGTNLLPIDAEVAASRAEISAFVISRLGALQMVSVPILLDPAENLGRLTIGFFLDDRLATQFRRLTGSDVAFAADGRILASSLPESSRAPLEAVIGTRDITTVQLDTGEYLALARPMAASGPTVQHHAGANPVVLILRSRTERLQFLSTVRTGLLGVLIGTVLLATILSYAVARTMTRPLAAVTGAMREVAATGDLTRRVAVRSRAWDDEDARLLATAFNTLTESIAKSHAEAAQRERLSSLGRLSTVIAHEIRNPLMIIRATLRTLRREEVTPTEVHEAAADIDEETSRLNRIVTEVLDFARPIAFELSEASLNEICRTSAAAASEGEPGAPIALDLDPAMPPMLTDAERLRTALVNILINARHAVRAAALQATELHNARQAAPHGGAEITAHTPRSAAVLDGPGVVVRTRRNGTHAVLTIEDRGIGITEEDMAHIFDPYFTTRRAGTGIGLPIAKNIIERLGGTIAVRSRPGEGTQIRIGLPLAAPDELV